VAESLDISAYADKRLINHKMSRDVTAGYIISDAERLRDPLEKIAKYFLEKSTITTASIIDLSTRRSR
jgi:hypothetical protein